MRTTGSRPNETARGMAIGDPTGLAGVVAIGAGVRRRSRLAAIWSFARHLVEMIVAMLVGMAALSLAIGALGEPPGYGSLLIEYGLMGAAMSVPMVAWMRFRGHSWWDGLEMTAAMLLPLAALVIPAVLGLLGTIDHGFMMLAHSAMIAGMVALMLYRRDRYAYGAHGRHH